MTTLFTGLCIWWRHYGSGGFTCASAGFVLPCWYAEFSSAACFSSVAAVTHVLNIWITELCEERNSATGSTRTWMCVCIVNLYLSGVKSKWSTTCFFSLPVSMETWHPASGVSLGPDWKTKVWTQTALDEKWYDAFWGSRRFAGLTKT